MIAVLNLAVDDVELRLAPDLSAPVGAAGLGNLVSTDDDLLTVAIRYGYGSTEAFGRAFHAVHGASPGGVRCNGGPLRTQPRIRFHLTVEGSVPWTLVSPP